MNVKVEDLKKKLSKNDIKKIMRELGDKKECIDNGTVLIFTTICHGGSKSKLYYYVETNTFYCYTHCGSMDIFSLIQKIKKISFGAACDYVANYLGLNNRKGFGYKVESAVDKLESDWDIINKYSTMGASTDVIIPIINPIILELFIQAAHVTWLDDNISYGSILKYNISYYMSQNKIVIPHYNAEGQLIGIRGRALNEEDLAEGKKYMPLYIEGKGYNHPLAFNLYGLHINKHKIKQYKRVILFESEKSILQMDTMYGDENYSLAICGSNISNFQRDLLLELGVEEVIIGLDKQFGNDKSQEAIEWAKKVKRLARKFVPYINTYILWDNQGLLDYKDSPTDKGKEVFEQLLANKIQITTNDYDY